MSHAEPKTTTAPAQKIPDFELLHPRQVRFNTWTVLSLSGDHPKAYTVDTDNLTCTCKDQQMRRETPGICKHIAKALFVAPQKRTLEDFAVQELTHQVGKLSDVLSQPQTAATPDTSPAPEETPDTDRPAGEADSAAQEIPPDVSLIEKVDTWLSANVPAADALKLTEGLHGDTRGVKIEPDYREMTDTQKETMKGAINSVEGRQVHVGFGDNTCETCGASDGEFYYFFPAKEVLDLA